MRFYRLEHAPGNLRERHRKGGCQRKPRGGLVWRPALMRFLVGDVRRVRFLGLAAAVIVMRVLQDGQFICRPSQSLLAKMGWRQVGQLKVNSFMGMLRLFLEAQDAQDDSVLEDSIGWSRPCQALTFALARAGHNATPNAVPSTWACRHESVPRTERNR